MDTEKEGGRCRSKDGSLARRIALAARRRMRRVGELLAQRRAVREAVDPLRAASRGEALHFPQLLVQRVNSTGGFYRRNRHRNGELATAGRVEAQDAANLT